MSVSPGDVLQMARLAELAVDEADLRALTEQMDRIVSFVAQLAEAGDIDLTASHQAGPDRAPLRPDVVNPAPLERPPAAIAPEFADGFFLVPRLEVMEEP
ncbi:MAG TPA: Asp-tRNA(Asn)/Glu-tRNA(Gln) amidotransferase subunit GatC [Gemmatimonadales bacterium]|nr:Asp-tRNA(Asn)/Glu-tRNA(Gln) amidotransferase subunit GatC [Gemmatimonadales bacterium]